MVPQKQAILRSLGKGICCNCFVEHTRYRDAAHTRFQSYCLSCHAAYMRDNRPPHRLLSIAQKTKAACRGYANVYQRRGKLAPKPCERCGDLFAEKHHDDYSKPLEVHWLCRPCHLALHRAVGNPGISREKASGAR